MIYNILNNWSKGKFAKRSKHHYTGIDIYCLDEDARGLYLQRDSKSGNLNYLRYSNRKFNFGISWMHWARRTKTQKYVYNQNGMVWDMIVDRIWFNLYFPPFTWIRNLKRKWKEHKEWKEKKAMLESGEYTMDPMGSIHHIDDDQAAYYE